MFAAMLLVKLCAVRPPRGPRTHCEPTRPGVWQVELHCWLQQRELVAYHEAEGIATMGFCPLARTMKFEETATYPLARSAARPRPALRDSARSNANGRFGIAPVSPSLRGSTKRVDRSVGRSEAQLALRWAVEKVRRPEAGPRSNRAHPAGRAPWQGYITIPKSSTPCRIAENADIFSMERLNADQVRPPGPSVARPPPWRRA
jgi:diketogulonate reductase-like aldo/keto reductase